MTTRHKITWTMPAEDTAEDLKPYLLEIHKLQPDDIHLMVEHIAKRRKTFKRQIREGQKNSDGLWKKES